MGVYGPYTAVAGAVQQCAVDPDAQAVYISNTTVYDLYIGMGAATPTSVTGFGGYPWVRRIPQGDRASVQIPQDRYAGAGFPGYIWVLPLTSAMLAPTFTAAPGTISSNNAFTIEGYSNPAEIPPDIASAQFQNLASQPRIIDLPVVPHILWPAGGITTFVSQQLAADGSRVTPTLIAPILAFFSPVLASPHVITVYFYASMLMLRGIRRCFLDFGVECFNASSVSLGNFDARVKIPLAAVQPAPYAPFGPIAWQLTCPVNTQTAYLSVTTLDSWPLSSGTNAWIDGIIHLDCDTLGQAPPPAIGNGTATPPGAIY